MGISHASTVLNKYKVLDLTRVRSGPTCVRQLADWGADVIKIEMPATDNAGQLGGPREGADFQNLHRNKRSLTLNLKDKRGLEVFRKLAREVDVIVENFRPDVKNRLGIDYETLSKDNPGLVYASISGFGQDGPLAKRPGFDQIAQGMGGLMSITGNPGEGPMRVGIPIADLTAGIFCSQAILLALLEREQSGKGQWVQTSLLQAQVFMLDFQAARWLVDGDVPKQAGNNHPTSIPTGVFKTSDAYMNIAVAGQAIWEKFCAAMGKPEWNENPDYATGSARSDNRDALNAEIEAETLKDTMANWIERLNAAGVPCGEINDIQQVFESPQVAHLGLAQPVKSHERGDTHLVGQPITMSRTPSTIASPPPMAGEHNQEVLTDLGFSADDIETLKRDGVI
ncbi:CoA transferase [uncultured Nisaea sp.]|jgi:crotonobetainyl-CoA:carnitine CoA-transferase CaiB-like acyl-CoA transferase|uniref:CaiB/BaiF CoA transferase family protein n=1 Tax=uncultured Nisaea sp. TaxID=538215 RepID=UPI0030EE88BF|tara:strand:- start:6033 stop:7223 length:1191 start_codon:yes stop_codon:yes gene_type:complete